MAHEKGIRIRLTWRGHQGQHGHAVIRPKERGERSLAAEHMQYVKATNLVLLERWETEILLTSLMDEDLYPYQIFKELYHLRWMTEKNYKNTKFRIEIKNLLGKFVESVY